MTTEQVPIHVYESAVRGRQMFRGAYRRAREENKQLRKALLSVRTKGLCAVAAFVLRNPDGPHRVIEVLNIIDAALGEEDSTIGLPDYTRF